MERLREKEGMIAELERDYKNGNIDLLEGLKKVSELKEEENQ